MPITGIFDTASANGNVISKNLSSCVRVGVKPCCPNHAAAKAVVKPIIKIFIATQETTWSPLCVTEANPCNIDNETQQMMANNNPYHSDPKTAAPHAAANAAVSIFPSKLKSITPDLSANSPANAANNKGVEIRSVALIRDTISERISILYCPLSSCSVHKK